MVEMEKLLLQSEDDYSVIRWAFGFSVPHEWRSRRRPRIWHPPTDVYETDSHLMVRIEVAGMHEEDFAISLDNRVLTIEGYREDPEAKLTYQRMEIPYGPFHIEVYLPWDQEPEDAIATYDNGFLTIAIPKQRRATKVPITHEDEGE